MKAKSLKQIQDSITPEDIRRFKLAMKREPRRADLADPDLLTPTARMQAGAVRMGRPPKPNRKKSIYIYFEPEVVDHLRATGRGWQTRVSDWVTSGVRQGAL
ncbi:MAG: BrnA antitoxin family protein [Candidatus Margulisbacteria bacterium]|jgi:uncharacterized protein (DUF4415 family)|nr:BrnA antitoxin family protein [Candidatus Margulisiibacteriota bacterium]